ncbi:cytochrome P450 [Nannocystis pusilla]|uniref:cytochrome P450 n=1 Tax=Nannocystis pusilla TaxID=889268 RepID=UPI003B76C4AB
MKEPTHRLPPGPRSELWQTLRYLRDPVGSILDLGRRYGDLFTLPSLGGAIVVASAPEAVRAIFSAEPDAFAPFAADAMAPVLGRGSVLLQHGAAHRRARKLMQPPFHGARMRAYGATMRDSARPTSRPSRAAARSRSKMSFGTSRSTSSSARSSASRPASGSPPAAAACATASLPSAR